MATFLARAATAGAREQVAAGLNALAGQVGGAGRAGHGKWATGSPECCVCPVCRAIAGLRDPDPETAERLATGAGEIATGVANLMRAVSSMTTPKPAPAPAPHPGTAWSAATRTTEPPATTTTEQADPWADPWAAASAASAASVAEQQEEQAAARAAQAEERRAAAQAAREAAAAAARRVAEAAAAATAAKASAGETGVTPAGAPGSTRTPERFDVWAAATAEPQTMDHDGPDASASAGRDGAAGDEARPGGAD
ncbi:MAG: hypothetical protein ABW046_13650 [Actinoplanes sp.]